MRATLKFKGTDAWSGYSIYPNCQQGIGPYVMRSGVRYTGLNGKENDAIRERLERELSIYLKPNSEYWDNFSIFIGEKDVELDTSIPEQELKWYFLKGHKRVAFGLNDRKPSTDYVLLQAEEEAKEKNVKARRKREAIVEFNKLSISDMRKALRLFGYSAINSSSEVIENDLYKLVEENPDKFLSVWVENKSKETQFLIEEAVSKGVLRKTNTTYKYGSDIVGYTLENAIDYLDNPANADVKAIIKAAIEGKEMSYGSASQNIDESKSQFSKLKKELEAEEELEVKASKNKKN